MLETCTHSTFNNLTDRKFTIYHGSDQPLETELIEVGDLVETNRQEMFAIYFRVPDGVIPAQGSYKLVNSELGELILLLVPVIHDESIIYEAVFNRLKKKKPTA